jgi:hypothetical protein
MRVVRVLGKLEPGGAQLALLRVMRGLERRHGVRPELWVGDATASGWRGAMGCSQRRFGPVERCTPTAICNGSCQTSCPVQPKVANRELIRRVPQR